MDAWLWTYWASKDRRTAHKHYVRQRQNEHRYIMQAMEHLEYIYHQSKQTHDKVPKKLLQWFLNQAHGLGCALPRTLKDRTKQYQQSLKLPQAIQ